MTARPDEPHLGLVVEGAGERGAIPIMLRKWLAQRQQFADILGKPVPSHGKGNASRDGGLESYVAVAAARPGCQAVMCFFDADEDCAATLGPDWQSRAQEISRVPVVVILAEPNFEQWLYSSVETLGLGIGEFDPSAKGSKRIVDALRPTKYVKPTWQPRLTQRIDFGLAVDRNKSMARALNHFDALTGLFL